VDFGTWLAERRHKAGLTMRELAGKTGLSAPYIATIEGNRSDPPPLKTCKALARGLNIGWQEIWQRSFAARLKRWLRREGFSRISDDEILDVANRLQSGGE